MKYMIGLFSLYEFTKYVRGYGTLHVHCTSRHRLGLWVRSCDAYMKWSPSVLLLNTAYYNVIGSVELHVILKWVLYVVHGTCWLISEEVVLGYTMYLWMPMCKYMKIMCMFTLVTLRFFLRVDGWMEHY